MEFVVDTSALIALERTGVASGAANVPGFASKLAVSVLTISELLEGVNRASEGPRRTKRMRFVEDIMTLMPILDFNLLVARIHSRLRSELAKLGTPIGAHDAIIAATALTIGAGVVTENLREFARVPTLLVCAPSWTDFTHP